ncbi:MAG: response regulator transcription factor [Planctomycetia bacterium]|nr:response regulator transcription factor [Planctomycetia bacterium]
MNPEKILVIEDDPAIRELVGMILKANGFTNITAVSGGELGLAKVREEKPDLLLLDLMLPGIGGLDVCRQLKASPETASIPIIMMTALGEESDIVLGLELGAADYVVKPFNNRTLVARIRAQLRRTAELKHVPVEKPVSETVRWGNLELNVAERSVKLDGQPLSLTFTEFEILLTLVRQPGRVFTRSQLALEVRGEDCFPQDRGMDVQIANLRRKLGASGTNIETVRGVGYRFKAE